MIQRISFSKGEYKFKSSEIDQSLSYGKLSQGINHRVKQEQQRNARHQQFVDQLKHALNKSREGAKTQPQEQGKGNKVANSPLEILLKPQHEDY
ncbi:hypothetical protein [Mucilaginibacter lappiensis]|uniref:Uncharacterized protein n=1 Tax=Mucilaginibacter lappiensis TaxID=354630 RepID=A0A841JL26_9SPHI|nr:hypothetical protein [Mucilaginibacter lappiensis]MBB6131657.1 hypothetical protein [Mucilaginibacter lappiensis]